LTSPGRRIAIALVLLLVCVEGTFYHPGEWNQNARFAATVAFVEPGTPYTGTFRIDGLRDGARLFTQDWARVRGAYYSNKAPGVSMMGVAPYFVLYHAERLAGRDPTTQTLTNVNAFLVNLCVSVFWNAIAALALMRRLPALGLFSAEGAIAVALVYSFGTLALPFGCSLWGHTTAAAFITLGLLDIIDGSRRRCLTGGLWLGLAVLMEYLAGISGALAAVFIVAGRDRFERLWQFGVGAAAPVGTLLAYQELAFGNFLTTAPSVSNPPFLEQGKVAGLFGLPDAVTLLRMLFRPERGLFWQTPILLFAIAGAVLWWRRADRRAVVALAVANIAGYVLSVSALSAFEGGVTTSMRYLIVALPFFCILLPDLGTFTWRRSFLVAFVVSAANMFAIAATSTMFESPTPLSQFVYPALLKGQFAFNPILAALGVRGALPGLVVAIAFAMGLAATLRIALRVDRTWGVGG
jgi:hypothetical protein